MSIFEKEFRKAKHFFALGDEGVWQGLYNAWRAENEANTALLREAREVLDKVEWVSDNNEWAYSGVFGEEYYCLFCEARKDQGHRPDCQYAALCARLNERLA